LVVNAARKQRPFGRLVRKDRLRYAEKWPYRIRVHLKKRGRALVRYMTCPICGTWWERPVGGTFGCSGRCSTEARRIIRESRMPADMRYYE